MVLLGVGTYIRLVDAALEDAWLLFGMNRLCHAYLEIDPGLEAYSVTGHHDDEQGLMETYGPDARIRSSRVLASTPVLVGLVDSLLCGVLAGLLAHALDLGSTAGIVAGVAAGAAGVAIVLIGIGRLVARARALLVPRFPR